MRVDNEISLLHRMLLLARNSAINNELYVTICPLNDSNICTDNWQGQLSVFSDINKNRVYEANNDELLLKVKPAIKNNDKLQYGQRRNALLRAVSNKRFSSDISASTRNSMIKSFNLGNAIVVRIPAIATPTINSVIVNPLFLLLLCYPN